MRFCEKNIHISNVILFSHQCQRHYNLYRCNRFPQLYNFWSLDFLLFYFGVYFKVNLMPPMLKSSSHELIRKPLISCCVTFVGTVLYHREKRKVCNISRWDQPLSFLCAPAMALIKYCTLVITTSLLWPSLWHLSTHWSSTAGFQAWTSVHKKHKWALWVNIRVNSIPIIDVRTHTINGISAT